MPRATRTLRTLLATAALTVAIVNCGDDGGPRLPADIALSALTATFAATSDAANPVPVVVQITNSGDEPLTDLQASVAFAAGEPAGWLSASLSRPAAPSTLTMSAVTVGLHGGEYHAIVTIASPTAAHGSGSINVTFSVARAAPAAPTELSADAPEPRRIVLTWRDNSSIEDGVRIERCEGASCSDFAYIGAADADQTQFIHENNSSPDVTYRFRVQAVNSEGLSAFSNIAQVTTPQLPAIALAQSSTDLSSAEGKPGTATITIGVANSGGGALTGLAVQPIVYGSEPRGFDWLTATLDRTTAPAVLTLDAAPAGLVAGTYTATVSVSAPGASNSPQSILVTFRILRPDLAITAPEVLAVSPAQTAAPGQVTFPPISVTNVGDGEASHVLVAFLLSRDAVLDRSDRLLIQYSAGPLGRNATLEVPAMTLAIPAGVPDGDYTIGVLVNPDGDVPELRADNNAIGTGFVLGAARGALNVSVAFLTFSAVSGGANPPAQTATVVNNGPGALDQLAVGTIAYGPGQPAGWLTATLDRTTAPATLSFAATTGTLLPGSYTATVPVESPSATNSPQLVSVVFGVAAPLPDLTVTGAGGAPFTVTPTTVEQVQVVRLSPAVVTNIGVVPSGAYRLGIYLSADAVLSTADYLLEEGDFAGLPAGGSSDIPELAFYVPADVAPGFYYIGILVDGPGVIAEAHEDNNAVAATLTVTPGAVPPIAPSALSASVTGLGATFNWTDNSTDEQGFRVERCTGLCSYIPGQPAPVWQLVSSVAANTTSYVYGGHTAGTTYSYRIVAFNANGQSVPSNTVTFTAGVPQAPTNLSAAATSASAIGLTWTDNATFETNYEIARCAGSGCVAFAVIATIGADATSYQDGGLGETTTYSYRVRALSGTGNSSYSNTASATTQPSTVAPPAPSGLLVTVVSGNQIDLAWTDNATNEAGFRIERCAGTGCTTFAEIALTGANAVSYQSTALAGGTVYRFRVRAYNSVGSSAYTPVASGTTLAVPQAPTALSATVINSGRVNLSWTDNATTETGFRIESCSGACTSFTLLASVSANAVTYADDVYPNDRLRYRVYAYNANGISAYSNEVTAAVPPLEAPSGVLATALSSARVQLSWTNIAPQFATSAVEIQRCAGPSCTTFTQIADITQSGATQSYINTGLTGVTTYSYRVRATRAVPQSAWSATVTVTTPAVPAAPTGLTASSSSSSSVLLNWADNASNESGFRIERCAGVGCTNFTILTTTGANTTSYTNAGLGSATIYRYRVRATDGDANSDPSNEVTVTTQQAAGTPVAPSNLTASALASGLVNLSWIDNASNETGYIVERCAGVGCTSFAVVVNTAGVNVTNYTSAGQLPETSYSFRVRVFNAAGNTVYSNTASVTTPVLAAPSNLVATAVSATQVNLSWVDNSSNETGFLLERCAGDACTVFTQIATPAANAITFVNAPVTGGTTYSYRVRGANGTSRSAYSNVAVTTTP